MKVLIWTQYFWPENFHINAVARSLHEQGIEVTILTGKPNYPEGEIFEGYKATGIQKEDYSGFEVIRIPLRQRGKNSGKGMALNYLSFIVSGYLFAPFALRGKKFDVVFVYAPSPLLQTLPAIYLAWLKRAPLVLWVQDIWPDALVATGFVKNKWILGSIEIAVRYIYHFTDCILIQSEAFRSSLVSRVNKVDKIRYFPNSAECKSILLPIAQVPDISNVISQSFSVVFTGNIGTVQSCETIIAAAKQLQHIGNLMFYLVGDGSMVDDIKRSIEVSGLENIVMTGRVPTEDMSSIYESASVLLLSLKDNAVTAITIPNKLQGYLSSGKPIIVSSNGESAKVLIKANAGLTCPAEDANALANAVLMLYEMSPEERDLLGSNGLKYFEKHYNLQNRVVELIALFKDIVSRKN